jgi:hypothetical protein
MAQTLETTLAYGGGRNGDALALSIPDAPNAAIKPAGLSLISAKRRNQF